MRPPLDFLTDLARAARPVAHREVAMITEKDRSGNYIVDISWLRRGIDEARRREQRAG